MNKKLLWALLAIAAVVVVILAITLPKAESKGKTAEPAENAAETSEEAVAEPGVVPEAEQEESPVLAEGELPLDMTQPQPMTDASGEQSAEPAGEGEITPFVDPETGMELEEDELPIDTP